MADHVARLTMDVTDRTSIAAGRDVIASKEGKLHILVNKYARVLC